MATVRHLGLLPFCISQTNAAVGSLTNYPVGFAAVTLLKWYWRVKSWSVSATLTSDNFYAGGTYTYSGTVTNNNILHSSSAGSTATSEKNLVCRRRTVFSETTEASAMFVLELFASVEKSTDLFYPYIDISFDVGLAGSIGLFQAEGVESVEGQFITIDGVPLPSYCNGDVVSGSISVSASHYWPYDPGDGGGPIYDSATGAQLRPFPN
jgi:hypothetical protein